MVLEQVFRVQWIAKKEHAFLLSFVYTIIGIVSALLIFPSSVGIMSIAFTSILLVPSLATLLRMEENEEIRENKLSLPLLMRDHGDIFKVYLYMFLGIFLAFSLVSLMIPTEAIGLMFTTQIDSAGIVGKAFDTDFLHSIVINNFLVLVVSFLLSIIYGAGAVIFLTWNASVWGVVFAYFVKEASEGNFFGEFVTSIVPFLPHMVTEAIAYISAAIAGGVLSKAVIREKLFSKKFHHILTDALILLGLGFILVIIGGVIEVYYAGLL